VFQLPSDVNRQQINNLDDIEVLHSLFTIQSLLRIPSALFCYIFQLLSQKRSFTTYRSEPEYTSPLALIRPHHQEPAPALAAFFSTTYTLPIMLRRPATVISLTTDDLAEFTKRSNDRIAKRRAEEQRAHYEQQQAQYRRQQERASVPSAISRSSPRRKKLRRENETQDSSMLGVSPAPQLKINRIARGLDSSMLGPSQVVASTPVELGASTSFADESPSFGRRSARPVQRYERHTEQDTDEPEAQAGEGMDIDASGGMGADLDLDADIPDLDAAVDSDDEDEEEDNDDEEEDEDEDVEEATDPAVESSNVDIDMETPTAPTRRPPGRGGPTTATALPAGRRALPYPPLPPPTNPSRTVRPGPTTRTRLPPQAPPQQLPPSTRHLGGFDGTTDDQDHTQRQRQQAQHPQPQPRYHTRSPQPSRTHPQAPAPPPIDTPNMHPETELQRRRRIIEETDMVGQREQARRALIMGVGVGGAGAQGQSMQGRGQAGGAGMLPPPPPPPSWGSVPGAPARGAGGRTAGRR